MSTPPDEILIERRLRAAEIALETARRRRFETDETVRTLQAEIADMEAALSVAIRGRQQARAEADARVAEARDAQRAAEQRFLAERDRRRVLEAQIAEWDRQRSERDELTRELWAERRVRRLEGELELVSRRAAEFEYGARMAALDALKLLRELAHRVGVLSPGGRAGDPAGADNGADAGVGDVGPAGGERPLESQRLDAALERLRASAGPPEGDL